MDAFAPVLTWLQESGVATAIGGSSLLTGFLSAVHLLGLALLVGAVIVSSLRLLGVVLPAYPLSEVTRATRWGIWMGLTVSLVTGFLLFTARASFAFDSGFFRVKMLLLVAAAVFHVSAYQRVMGRDDAGRLARGAAGALGPVLWFGVVVAGCAYILLE